jgi:hypothetical protein
MLGTVQAPIGWSAMAAARQRAAFDRPLFMPSRSRIILDDRLKDEAVSRSRHLNASAFRRED